MSIQTSDKEVLHTCIEWLNAGHRVELITVARTWGSSPRPPGSLAAVRDDGAIVGSVSGGCVEKQLSESFRGQGNARVHSHTIDDQQARQFGLPCGGNLELVFETLHSPETIENILKPLHARQQVCRTLSLDQPEATIRLATPDDAFHYDGQKLVQVFGPEWRLLLIGAGQLSRYVAEFALPLGFDVFVCEPRPAFQEAWQVDSSTLLSIEPHEAVLAYGCDAQTAVLALSHDPNLDDMAVLEALPSEAFFVGALGSKRNYERRCARLSALLEQEELAKLRSPVGLAIGSRTSAEIAISIVAELIQVRTALNTARKQTLD